MWLVATILGKADLSDRIEHPARCPCLEHHVENRPWGCVWGHVILQEIASSNSGPHHVVSPPPSKASSSYYPTRVLVNVSYQSCMFARCQLSIPTSKKSPEAWMGSFTALCSQTVQLRVLHKYRNLDLCVGKPNFFWWAAWLTLSFTIVQSWEPE